MAILLRHRAAGRDGSTDAEDAGTSPASSVGDGHKSRRALVVLSLLGVFVAGTAIVAVAASGGGSSAKKSGTILGAATATVQRRDLVETDTVTGTLGYGDSRSVYNRLSGTVTWVPKAGALIASGQVLYRVDGKGVYLFNGTQPAHRAFAAGMSDGTDVLQLNRALRAMGYDAEGAIEIDKHFGEATAAAIKRWQSAHGMTETGEIEFGRIVFQPGPRRVETIDLSLGGNAGSSATASSGSAGSSSEGSTTSGAAYKGSGSGATTAAVYEPAAQKARASAAIYVAAKSPPVRAVAADTTTPAPTTSPTTTPTTPTATAPTTPAPTTTTPVTPTTKTTPAKAPSKRAAGKGGTQSVTPTTSTAKTAAPTAGSASGATGSSSSSSSTAGSSQTANVNVALVTTSSTRLVTVALEAAKQREARVGEAVQITLPAGEAVGGHISSVASVAVQSSSSGSNSSSSSTATVKVEISLDKRGKTSGLDQAPVSVAFAAQRERNALAIPVTALVASSGGGYAVEEVQGTSRTLVTVTPGIYAGGFVGVSGVSEGTVVTDGKQ